MFYKHILSLFSSLLLSSTFTSAQLSDSSSVGPLTPLSAKSKICNVLHYGAVADNKTDLGPALSSTFSSCIKGNAATLYIPPGSYSIATGVILTGGSGWAMQIDGLITLTSGGSFGGNAVVIKNANDVEVFSSNGLGAINGQGYITRLTSSGQNARLFRFISSKDISIHDMIFVDAPTFHLVFNNVKNLEAYRLTVRGPNIGGTDGVDLICDDNCYLHDIEVTNRDECISVKSPSHNVLIEDIYCNHSGGMSIGSLTANGDTPAEVSNIVMRNIYSFQCTQMLMIKTFPGGDGVFGYVNNSVFENFWGYDTTYALDIDQYWQSTITPNTGAVGLSGLTFTNWTGSLNNGASRGAIVIRGSDQVPLNDISLKGFDMWTINGNKVLNVCKNVYGTGYCARADTGAALTTFTSTMTTTAAPTAYASPVSPAWGISGYGVTIPIPVYTPAVLWGSASSSASATSSAAAVKATATSSSSTNVSVAAAVKSTSTSRTSVSSPSASSILEPTSSASILSTTKQVTATITSRFAPGKSHRPRRPFWHHRKV